MEEVYLKGNKDIFHENKKWVMRYKERCYSYLSLAVSKTRGIISPKGVNPKPSLFVI